MKRRDLFPSKYSRGDDFAQGPQVATISYVTSELFPDKEQETAIAHFERPGPKPVPLNLTNFMSIAAIANSDETDDWRGTVIELYRTEVTVHGEAKAAVRIRPPSAQAIHAAHAAASNGGDAQQPLWPEEEPAAPPPQPPRGSRSPASAGGPVRQHRPGDLRPPGHQPVANPQPRRAPPPGIRPIIGGR
jgi:hypothetical protein